MEDLSAASVEDVQAFFRYLLRARERHPDHRGRLRPRQDQGAGRAVLRAHPGRPAGHAAALAARSACRRAKRIAMEAKIQQPQLYVDYPSPANFAPGDRELDVLANVLGNGKSSRLYKRLVYELKIAQSVSASQQSQLLVQHLRDHRLADAGAHPRRAPGRHRSRGRRAQGQAGRRRRARSGQEPDRIGDSAQPRAPAGPRRAAPVVQLPPQ